jgi:hypothetical protein
LAGRTFIVKISESPLRVTIEDVRSRRRIVPPDLDAVGPYIARLLEDRGDDAVPAPRADETIAPQS